MKHTLLIAATLLSGIVLPAQNKISLEVGANFPYRDNMQLNELLSQEHKGRGRKIIIDLFSSSCIVCFRMMPKMQEIQEKYRDSIRVVLLGKSDGDIKKVFDKFKSKLSLTFDPIYDSTFFRKYSFPSLPHYIWLDENGIIQATTGTDELNSLYIERFIAGLPLTTDVAAEKQTFDDSKLFLVNGNGGPDTGFLFRSVLSRWDKSQADVYPSRLAFSPHGHFFQALGISIADLYRYAYLGWAWWSTGDPVYGKLYFKPIIVGNDTAGMDIERRFNYSFKSNYHGADEIILQTALRNDLSTYFGFEAIVIERLMPCWKLIATAGAKERLRSKATNRKYRGSYSEIDYQKVTISHIIQLFEMSRLDDTPVIDATGIDYPIDISFKAVLYDRESVVEAIRKLGLDLVPDVTLMKVLLLQKK